MKKQFILIIKEFKRNEKQNFQKVDDGSIDMDRLWVWNKETNGIERMSKKYIYADMDI